MKALVLGASGRCGSWLVKLGAERGYDLSAVARSGSAYYPPENARLLQGDVTDTSFIRSLLPDFPVIFSCIGLRRNGLSPWARLLSPPDLVSRVAENILNVLSGSSKTRLIWISAGGVGSSRQQTTKTVGQLIRSGNVGVAYQDLENAEARIRESGIAAMAVRPVTLTPGRPAGNAGPVHHYGLFSTVRRSNVARWMLDYADGLVTAEGDSVLLGKTDRQS